MATLIRFARDCAGLALRGSAAYYGFLGAMGVLVAVGGLAYVDQLRHGLAVTGMHDAVTWGAYIANFTYFIGVAAAGVMLVIPAYVFHRQDAKQLVLIAEGMAVVACLMALCFVVVDLGRPERMFYLLPFIGTPNLPRSLLAWDVVVVPGYLLLNLAIPAVVLYGRYRGREVSPRLLLPWVLLTILWAIALHTVTAFLFSADIARPFWHSSLLGPRFLASAFCSGPALLILALHALQRWARLELPRGVVGMLAVIVTVALQVNLVMLGSELFVEFYAPTEHSLSATYLFVGLDGKDALVPWIRLALGGELLAVAILMVRPLRERTPVLLAACAVVVAAVWVEKGMGLIVPGFIPTPLGEVIEYTPSAAELQVSVGIWALGAMAFAVLAKVAIAIDRGDVRAPSPP